MALNVLFEHYKEPGHCSGSQVTIRVLHAGYPATGLPLPVSSVLKLLHLAEEFQARLVDRASTSSAISGESGDQNGPINDPINGPIKGPIKGVALEILHLIQANPGIKKAAIAQQIGKSETTVKRYAKMLADANLIEYKDSNKTGGYFAK